MKENKTLFLLGPGSTFYNNETMNNKSIKIEVDTMSNICRKYTPKNETIQFCKIDVEGGEKDVLLGYDFENYRPKVFCIEATQPNTSIPCHDLWEDMIVTIPWPNLTYGQLKPKYVQAVAKKCPIIKNFMSK